MKSLKTLTFILVLTVLLNACSSKKAQTKKYFRLNSTPSTQTVAAVKPLTLVVKRPKALSILGGRPIVATQTDDSLVQLSHNYWIESPKVLLQDRIKQWAENYWQTVSYQIPANTEHQTLETRILAFEKKQNLAVVNLEFILYDNNNQLILNQQINATENIQQDTYKSFVKAISLAVESIFTELSNQL